MAISGRLGAVYVQTATAPQTFTTQATTANSARTRYTITNTTYRYWSLTDAISVYVDAVLQTSGYTLERAGGVVVFATPRGPAEAVTVTGKYVTLAQAAGFYNWSAEVGNEPIDVTEFQPTSGWRSFLQVGIKEWSFSAEAYWTANDPTLFTRLTAGSPVVVVLYMTGAGGQTADTRFEGYAVLDSEGIENTSGDVVKFSISGTGLDVFAYR